MQNFAPQVAKDRSGEQVQDANFVVPAKVTTVGTPVASSVITFGANTTAIEISALGIFGNSLAVKWGSGSVITAAGTANFDHVIPAGYWRRFVIPMNTIGVQSVVGLNSQLGLYSSMSLIGSTASVISQITEY